MYDFTQLPDLVLVEIGPTTAWTTDEANYRLTAGWWSEGDGEGPAVLDDYAVRMVDVPEVAGDDDAALARVLADLGLTSLLPADAEVVWSMPDAVKLRDALTVAIDAAAAHLAQGLAVPDDLSSLG